MFKILNGLIFLIACYIVVDYFFYEPTNEQSDISKKIDSFKEKVKKKKLSPNKRNSFKDVEVLGQNSQKNTHQRKTIFVEPEPHTAFQDESGKIYPTQADVQDKYIIVMGDVVAGEVSDIEKYETGEKTLFIGAPTLWPNNTVFYHLNSKLKRENRRSILSAIEEFRRKTTIRFVKRSNQDNYISFEPATTDCYSQVGLQGGKQIVGVSEGCGKPQVVHELMHALGFFHEQNRPDRDDYIRILWENIEEEYWSQFDKINIWLHEDPTFPFNFNTIMLYNSTYFRREGSEDYSMVTVQGDPFMKKYTGLTKIDIKRLEILYPKK